MPDDTAAGTPEEERGEGTEDDEEPDDDSREGEDESVDEVDDDEDEYDAFEFFRRLLCFRDRFNRRLSLFELRCFDLLSGLAFVSSFFRLSSRPLPAWSSVDGLPSLSALSLSVVGAWKAEEAVRRLLPIDELPTGVLGDGETSIDDDEDVGGDKEESAG